MKVDLACGLDIKNGYEGIDIVDYGHNKVLDIVNNDWGYLEGSVDAIDAWHIFEHLSWNELEKVLEQCAWVMKKGAILHVQVPDGTDSTQFRPYHVTQWGKYSFSSLKDIPKYAEWFVLDKFEVGKYGHLNYYIKRV